MACMGRIIEHTLVFIEGPHGKWLGRVVQNTHGGIGLKTHSLIHNNNLMVWLIVNGSWFDRSIKFIARPPNYDFWYRVPSPSSSPSRTQKSIGCIDG